MRGELDGGGLIALLRDSEQYYQSGRGNAAELGQALYRWLDGAAEGWLQRLRDEHAALTLQVSVEEGMRHLPLELLLDQGGFVCTDATHLLIPVRRVQGHASQWTPHNRALRVLFMATSPVDVKPTLQYEQEEAKILEATRRTKLELIVEESGTLKGLQEWVDTFPEDQFDVVHLTGHADVLGNQPVFLCEDEQGRAQRASARDIATVFSDSGRFPRLLFLSGCRTGQAAGQGGMPSLCEALVQAGVPAVLGWALPVGDQAATLAAAELYERLANGVDLARALAHARSILYQKNSPYWPLLRLYSSVNGRARQSGDLSARALCGPPPFGQSLGKPTVTMRHEHSVGGATELIELPPSRGAEWIRALSA